MPDENSTTQQILFRRRLGFFFIFRIVPGFFLGFFPRRWGTMSADHDYGFDDEMMIHHISEQEFMTLRRAGIPEVPVMMGMGPEY